MNPTRKPFRARTAAAGIIAGATLLVVPACSSSEEPEAAAATTEATSTTNQGASATSSTTSSGSTGSIPRNEHLADWANPYETPGEKLTTLEGEGFTVDIYQVGTGKASSSSAFVDPDTSVPLLQKGDPVVYVNYVFTNTSGESIPLSSTLVDMDAAYSDWHWLHSMNTSLDRATAEEVGVLSSAISPEAGGSPFVWEPGTTFSVGESFAHQPGSAITFDATLTPVDEDGGVVMDQTRRGSVDTKIN